MTQNDLLNYYNQLNRDFCYYYETGVLTKDELLELTYSLFHQATDRKNHIMVDF